MDSTSYYTSKYSGEQIDEAVRKILDGEMTGDYADRQLSNLDTPQAALANLGAGVRPNLLDNAIFIGGGSQQGGGQLPVNQRGQTSYVDGNVIDRWKLSGNGGQSLTIASDGIILTSTADYGFYFTQNLEQSVIEACLGKKVTASVLSVGQNTAQASLNLYVDNTWKDYMVIQEGLSTKQFTIPLTANSFYINIGAQSSGTCKLIAVKLEFGSTQTLAYQDEDGVWQLLPQPESDYATQLAKCQRYYQIYSTADARPSKAVDCRPVMRTDPAQGTIVVGDTTYYYNTAEL
ncbi:hypothetical protein [Agathobaculum sp.]|uniref:hypothetical protein n=1 Tax=Agathobaculum sp. TaxID=2048138 RepID=UPI00399F3FED